VSAGAAVRRLLGGKRKIDACGPRHFLARLAVAKKKPRSKPFWLVEWSAAMNNPLGRALNKGWPKGQNVHAQVVRREGFKMFCLRLGFPGKKSGKCPN
jgi:hypothetical protein